MKETRLLMDMPITVEVLDPEVKQQDIDEVFQYFTYIDNTFSMFKPDSEISKINQNQIAEADYSTDMKEVFRLCEETKRQSHGFFNIAIDGRLDPSGLVKGWAIYNASKFLKQKGYKIFYVDAGGDIQANGKKWKVGIRNPFNQTEIIKILSVENLGVATSGIYQRGQHIYNPHTKKKNITDIVSITLVGPNVYEADRFATAAFAMGRNGIRFVEELPGFECYMIDAQGIATFTSSFEKYFV